MPENPRKKVSKRMKNTQEIADFTDDMLPGKKNSPKMEALLSREKVAVRKRIIERGIVHFRADKEFMTALLNAADQLKVAPGTLCRRIVWEQLKSLKAPADKEEEAIRSIADEIMSGQMEIKKELKKIRSCLGER